MPPAELGALLYGEVFKDRRPLQTQKNREIDKGDPSSAKWETWIQEKPINKGMLTINFYEGRKMEYGKTKEELLSIHSYEEFNAKREKFKGIEIDDEIMDHLCRNVFNRLTASYDEYICWDSMRTANKKEY